MPFSIKELTTKKTIIVNHYTQIEYDLNKASVVLQSVQCTSLGADELRATFNIGGVDVTFQFNTPQGNLLISLLCAKRNQC